jgi:hypothetical protein
MGGVCTYRVARFFLTKYSKTKENVLNYQMAITYTK